MDPNHQDQAPHIVLLPTPGMGHIIPMAELAKRLVHRHGFTFTFIIPTDGSPNKAMKSLTEALPSSISSVFLPPVSFDDLPADTKVETRIALTVVRSLSHVREAVAQLAKSKRLAALVVDLFGTDGFEVAREFNLAPYVFYPSTAMCLSLFLYLPKLDSEVSCEYRDLPEPVRIPGCIPIPGTELLDPVQDRTNDAYKWVLHHAKRYRMAEGILVNSFMELEGGAIRALLEKEPGKPPVYPVGPLVKKEPSTKADVSGCMAWLDKQPRGSVLYISFGSGGTLSSSQITELALGLEMSEQRFLWVVRTPNDQTASATYFGIQKQREPLEFLPSGFLERTKERGLVVPSWAPQEQVLAHEATGGFLSHCGWNSTLESVVNGVPLIAWPLYAEQKGNAFMLTHEIKVALRVKAATDRDGGIIDREEIGQVVKKLMEGEEGKKIRNRMRELKEAAATVISEGGSSTKALDEVALKLKWKNNHTVIN